ncbi:glycoside hydrolase family 128 protein [Parathielavia hyrcaniae]|uniref:Glycoside hydrolase family 128 protein n=1 Tax=Parathielavia hyrcaniae TaxID=113614 RepID=A0AAN6Q7Z7_9PEZI|nr:glycoside hydrolase family 128 protein [Parathielavia hyrcaniae]
MFSKALVALAAASIVGQTAASPHKHGLQHAHQKRALVTELTTVTDWVTVTVTGDEPSTKSKVFYTHSRKVKSTSSSESTTTSTSASPDAAPEQSSPPPPPAVEVVPSSTSTSTSATPEEVIPPATTSEAPAPEVPAPTPTAEVVSTSASVDSGSEDSGGDTSGGNGGTTTGGGTSGGNGGTTTGASKRGLAYNRPELLQRFLSAGTKVSWAYNWGQSDDSGTDLEFCPMLWGLKLDFAQTWLANAQRAIDAGSRCLLSFNEPDLGEQANLPPSVAAAKHIELMNPFSGKALIGSPAITNSINDGQGISYLQQWFEACGGQCAVDFVNIHIYGVDTNVFLNHLLNAHRAFNKPIWITEFGFGGTEDEINAQLETVIDQIENNATFSFVERYSYFMVEDGFMAKGNSMSSYGNTFAYGA